MATTFAQDAFTDSDGVLLQSHVPTVGGSWTKHTSWAGQNQEIKTNTTRQVAPDAVNDQAYYNGGSPASADYYAQMLVAPQWTIDAFSYLGPAVRIDTGAKTCYFLVWRESLGWQCFKVVAGAYTQIGSTTTGTPLAYGTNRTVRLDIQGTTLTCTADGTGVAGSPITDSSISAAGKAGFVSNSPTNSVSTSIWGEDFIAVGADPSGGEEISGDFAQTLGSLTLASTGSGGAVISAVYIYGASIGSGPVASAPIAAEAPTLILDAQASLSASPDWIVLIPADDYVVRIPADEWTVLM